MFIVNEFCFVSFLQISEIGKKGWSTLNGANLSSPQAGYESNFGDNYQNAGIPRSQSYQADN